MRLAEMERQTRPAVQELAAFIRASRRGFAHCRGVMPEISPLRHNPKNRSSFTTEA